MRLAIMQPYFLPYLGYFQLISCVDRFVIYDDVNYINRGWINRNQFLLNNKAYMYTVPLNNASQNRLINEICIVEDERWKKKFLKTIKHGYQKAPYFTIVFDLLSTIILADNKYISKFNTFAIETIRQYLNIQTELVQSSSIYNNFQIKGQDRILDICKLENAKSYVNPIGGKQLYTKKSFRDQGINLFFLESVKIEYGQFNNLFISNLSIVDILMFNSIEKVRDFLNSYSLD